MLGFGRFRLGPEDPVLHEAEIKEPLTGSAPLAVALSICGAVNLFLILFVPKTLAIMQMGKIFG